jgi:ribosome maturation factor RimP
VPAFLFSMMDRGLMDKIFAMANTELSMMGFELIDIEFVGKSLRLTIDKPGGVTLGDCVSVTRRVSLLLDTEDPIESNYRLEVSSPGLNRKLKTAREFEHFSGRRAKVQTDKGIFRGTITALKGENVIFEVEGSEVSVGLNDIIKANLDF